MHSTTAILSVRNGNDEKTVVLAFELAAVLLAWVKKFYCACGVVMFGAVGRYHLFCIIRRAD